MTTSLLPKEALIKSLSDFTLGFLCIARNNLTRIASYLRKVMTKLCIKILVESDNDLISASLGSRDVVIPAPTSFRIERG